MQDGPSPLGASFRDAGPRDAPVSWSCRNRRWTSVGRSTVKVFVVVVLLAFFGAWRDRGGGTRLRAAPCGAGAERRALDVLDEGRGGRAPREVHGYRHRYEGVAISCRDQLGKWCHRQLASLQRLCRRPTGIRVECVRGRLLPPRPRGLRTARGQLRRSECHPSLRHRQALPVAICSSGVRP